MDNIKKSYNQVIEYISKKQLKPAFDLIEKLISEHQLVILKDEHNTLEQTYKYMLQYTVEGTKDPEREKVYRKLILSTFQLADKLQFEFEVKKSPRLDYEKIRTREHLETKTPKEFLDEIKNHYENEALSQLESDNVSSNKNERDEKLYEIIISFFNYYWLKNSYSNEDLSIFHQFIDHTDIESHYKALMISSVNLSLLRFFDKEKFILLLDAMLNDDLQVSQRSLVTLLINLYKYDNRLPFYSDIINRLKILSDDDDFTKNLETVLIQLIRSRDTEKLQERIQKEIIPEMIKISPTLKDKLNFDSLMEDGDSDDENPEWQEIFEERPGLMDKMEEFSQLQMEGADVFLSSFAMLKSYPFFNTFTNWLLPFYTDNYQINRSLGNDTFVSDKIIESISNAPILCNSDKYSFCLSLQQIPKENREFIAQGLESEMGQLDEITKDEEITDPDKKRGFISNQYIQDLYRFFKLHPRKNDFEDIFLWDFDFHNKYSINILFNEHASTIRNIAEYYFSKNHYKRAIEIFERLLKTQQDGELHQKVGFSYQKLGKFEKALDSYKKAELYELNKKWNLEKIALCYRNLKQYDEALKYYQEIEQLDPDNLKNQLNIAHSLLEMEKYDEALKCYFKIEYLSPGNKKVWRPIAWCSFVTGKIEQSEKYYHKLLEDDPNEHDLMNMGHVEWSLGYNKKALDYYKQAISQPNFTAKEFFSIFEEDYQHLVQLGVNKEDIPILMDQLRYSLES